MGRVCSTLAEDAKWLQNFSLKTELKEMPLRGWGGGASVSFQIS